MKKAVIVLDAYKQPIFEKRLKEANISFSIGPGVTPTTVSLAFERETLDEITGLGPLVKQINQEATR